MSQRILVVDDDENIVRLLKLYLLDAGYEVTVAADGSEALDRFRADDPDLVLLDVMMPVINGWEVLRMLRAESATPVILLTSRDMVEDKVRGFGLGADDYIVKPFEPQEVLVRIRARMRKAVASGEAPLAGGAVPRQTGDAPGTVPPDGSQPARQGPGSGSEVHERGVVVCGDLRVDLQRYEVTLGGEQKSLKPKEIQLLYFLLQNRNIVFSRDQLLEKVWEYDFLVDTRTVDVHVKRLRQVIGAAGKQWALRTVWGVGYKMEVQA